MKSSGTGTTGIGIYEPLQEYFSKLEKAAWNSTKTVGSPTYLLAELQNCCGQQWTVEEPEN